MCDSELQIGHAGSRSWWKGDTLHREDGPAVEKPDGYKSWYWHGRRHRIDGPAIEYPNGEKAWYIHGFELDPIEHFLEVQRMSQHE